MESTEAGPTVARRLFDVPELLELILLQLPPRSILATGARVSRQWRDVAENSLRIQQKLFFKARAGTTTPYDYRGDKEWSRPSYTHDFDMSYALNPSALEPAGSLPKNAWSHHRVYLNFYDGKHPIAGYSNVIWRVGLTEHRPESSRGWQASRSKSGRSPLSIEAQESWRKCYLTDPPCSTVVMEVICYHKDFRWDELMERVAFSVRDIDGIRLGLIELLAQKVWTDLSLAAKAQGGHDVHGTVYVRFVEPELKGFVSEW